MVRLCGVWAPRYDGQVPPLIRTRFAPAPTGYLHLGGARTALFNWMYARHHGGEFVLRIEDTDTERSRPELIDVIYRVLEWLGLDWDGEPVLQSQRSQLYADAVASLLESGHAYWCGCTPDEVKARAEARGGTPGYDRHCRTLELGPGPGRVVRFAVPDDGTTGFDDVIRGPISFDNAVIEDFVIQRSTGAPLFLVANAVDDPDMGVTHVIRGEDLINVTPKVLLLRHALGVTDDPVFAHLPLIVNDKRQKLSKRRDDVSVGDYINRGIPAEAMANYLALLGWGPPDGIEQRPIAEMVELFDLSAVSSSSAAFDVRKLEHISGDKIRLLGVDEFIDRSGPWLTGQPRGQVDAPAAPPWEPGRFDAQRFAAMAPLVQERVHTFAEVPGYVAFLFADRFEVDDTSWAKVMGKEGAVALAQMQRCATELAALDADGWRADDIERVVFAVDADSGLLRDDGEPNRKRAQAPVRVAVLGASVGPPLWESLEVLGQADTVARLERAVQRLAAEPEAGRQAGSGAAVS
jgi:glutamyl-tRNA synthetase